MSEIDPKLFEELKQLCVGCLNKPSVLSVNRLRDFLSKCDQHFVDSLNVYIAFPLTFIISKLPEQEQKCDSILVACCDCLVQVFDKSSTINKFEVVGNVIIYLFYLIDPQSPYQQQFGTSEEFLLASIRCLQSVVKKCDAKIAPDLVSPDFRSKLGHAIKTLLVLCDQQRYHKIKAEAVRLIGLLVEKCQSIESTDAADVFGWYVPGISSGLTKVMTADDKTQKEIIYQSLDAFKSLIILTCNNIQSEDNSTTAKSEFIVRRDVKWLKLTSEKLTILFKKITTALLSHHNWTVRRRLLHFASSLITSCAQEFVALCLSVLIQVPLTLLADQNSELSSESESFLDKFSIHFTESLNYLNIIHEEFYKYLNSLPRLMRTVSANEKPSLINLLYGYLKCLGEDGINEIVYSSSHKQKLFQCLIDITEFNFQGTVLLEKYTVEPTDYLGNSEKSFVLKHFKHFDDEQVQIPFEKCCQLIAKCDQLILIDYLVDFLRHSDLNPSLIYVCILIIKNGVFKWSELTEIVDEFVNFAVEKCQLIENQTQQTKTTIKDINKLVIQMCLVLDGIACCAKSCDKKVSHNFLFKCLCPLLSCAGSSNLKVMQTANSSLHQVAINFDYSSTNQMISSNLDYLVNNICIKLRHFDCNYDVLLVFTITLKLCDKDKANYFVDPIDQLLDTVDCFHHSQALPLLMVVKTFINTLRKWDNTRDIEFKMSQFEDVGKKSKAMIAKFNEFIRHKLNSRVDLETCDKINDIEVDEEPEGFEDSPNDKSELPFHISILKKILERCVHLMSSYESSVRLLVMEIVNLTLPIIKDYEDELLPLAHNLWSPLVERFYDKDIIVIKNAFPCLIGMSATCKDFIRARTMKEVIPKVLQFLYSQGRISYKKKKTSGYKFTLAYSIQLEILEGIGQLAVNIDLQEHDLWKVITAVVPYLSTFQPQLLQDAAVNALIIMAHSDLNSVWFYLKLLHNEQIIHSDKMFPEILFFKNVNKEYERNVLKILNQISL